MVYLLEKDGIRKSRVEDIPKPGERKNGVPGTLPAYLCMLPFAELRDSAAQLGITDKTVEECFRAGHMKFESHEGFDYIALDIPDDRDQRQDPHRICVYFTDCLLVIISDTYDLLDDLLDDLRADAIRNLSLGRVISLLFDKLTFDDAMVLEKMEQELADLEEDLMLSKDSDLIDRLVGYRKKLRTLKRYYEQLLEISEAIEQNENGLIEKSVLRYFKFHTGRVNRLYGFVLNLRDYVTQVREAYQAQIDINLNKVMKFFTVITSIFLPLTLLVGWYGMNLKMPEFTWSYGYPFVGALSVIIAAGTLIYFKKNKWF